MRVSVAMCTYNGATFVREQLESILAQSLLPDELVVCDDRSTDGTADIVHDALRSAPFLVRIILNEERLGSTGNFESAIRRCHGDIIFLSDQDDIWSPRKLAQMVPLFADPTVGLVFTDAELVDETLVPLEVRLWDALELTADERSPDERQTLQAFAARNVVTGATAAFRAELRDLILPFPHGIERIHDGWIALVCAATTRVIAIDEPLILYRQHARQQIGAPTGGSSRGAFRSRSRRGSAPQVVDMECLSRRLDRHEVLLQYPRTAQALKFAHDVMSHAQTRRQLPDRWWGRTQHVLMELKTGRYKQFSNGWRSAVKDVAGIRRRRARRTS